MHFARRKEGKTRTKWNTHDLELHSLALQLDSPNLEVDTNRGDVALRVRVVGETEQQAGLGTCRTVEQTDDNEHTKSEVSAATV